VQVKRVVQKVAELVRRFQRDGVVDQFGLDEPSRVEPSQAKPSQAKPSQAKTSRAEPLKYAVRRRQLKRAAHAAAAMYAGRG
jgi:hypothetical protein